MFIDIGSIIDWSRNHSNNHIYNNPNPVAKLFTNHVKLILEEIHVCRLSLYRVMRLFSLLHYSEIFWYNNQLSFTEVWIQLILMCATY